MVRPILRLGWNCCGGFTTSIPFVGRKAWEAIEHYEQALGAPITQKSSAQVGHTPPPPLLAHKCSSEGRLLETMLRADRGAARAGRERRWPGGSFGADRSQSGSEGGFPTAASPHCGAGVYMCSPTSARLSTWQQPQPQVLSAQDGGSVTKDGMTAKLLRAVEERSAPYFTVDSKVTHSSGAPSGPFRGLHPNRT